MKYKISFCLIIILFIIEFKLINVKKKNNEVKVCLCTMGKNENKYARQFIEHYKNLQVDKIFIYDNNDLQGEKFEEVIQDYIDSDYVEILNWRGRKRQVINIMNDCYFTNNMNYDWLIFYEFDEFLFLKDFTNIKTYLNDYRFHYCKKIYLNWLIHTDNMLLNYDKRPLYVRFPQIENLTRRKMRGGLSTIKSIIRGGIKNMKIECVHKLSSNIEGCNGFGKKINLIGIQTNKTDYKYYYIDHFFSKSTEEFINKINRGDVLHAGDNKLERIKAYFSINKVTFEKIKMIETLTGLNLSKLREKNKNIFSV